jgi:DNA repair photolyase
MEESSQPDRFRGRGAQLNPHNRFFKSKVVQEHLEVIDEAFLRDEKTEAIITHPKTIVNKVDSPDLRGLSMNPYQGCEHGCVYCYARNAHEYWGYSAGLDFERKIIVKPNAPELLAKQLSSPRWKPEVIMLSGNTDCYQPMERKYELTRGILKVLLRFRHPVAIITKNALIRRDIDILKEMAAHRLVQVMVSITGLDEQMRLKLEPRTASYKHRLETIRALNDAGIPVGVMAAPIIPGLNSHELPSILKAATGVGAQYAGYTMVRLNGQIGEIFRDWLEKTFPDRANKVWHQIQACHGGKVNDSRFGVRMRGEGPIAESIRSLFAVSVQKYGLNTTKLSLNTDDFNWRADKPQLRLF